MKCFTLEDCATTGSSPTNAVEVLAISVGVLSLACSDLALH